MDSRLDRNKSVPPERVREIVSAKRIYALRREVVLDGTRYRAPSGESRVCFTHDDWPVFGVGRTRADALNAFFDTFDFQWRHLVEVAEITLTAGGRRRRDVLREAVLCVSGTDTQTRA